MQMFTVRWWMMSHCLRMKFVHKLTEEDLSSCVTHRSLLYIRDLRLPMLSDSLHSHFPGLIPVWLLGGHPSFQAVCCTTLLLSNSTTSRLSSQVPSVTSYLYDFTFFKCSIFFLHYWNKNLSHCPAWICLLVLAWVQFHCMHFCTLHLLLVMWHAERNLNLCQKIIPQKHVSFPRTCS